MLAVAHGEHEPVDNLVIPQHKLLGKALHHMRLQARSLPLTHILLYWTTERQGGRESWPAK